MTNKNLVSLWLGRRRMFFLYLHTMNEGGFAFWTHGICAVLHMHNININIANK